MKDNIFQITRSPLHKGELPPWHCPQLLAKWVIHQWELHPLKLTVWCEITSERVLGPYFFKDNSENTVMITGKRYCQMLRNFVFPAVENTPGLWWQQDGYSLSQRIHAAVKANFQRKNNFQKCRVTFPIWRPQISFYGDIWNSECLLLSPELLLNWRTIFIRKFEW